MFIYIVFGVLWLRCAAHPRQCFKVNPTQLAAQSEPLVEGRSTSAHSSAPSEPPSEVEGRSTSAHSSRTASRAGMGASPQPAAAAAKELMSGVHPELALAEAASAAVAREGPSGPWIRTARSAVVTPTPPPRSDYHKHQVPVQ